VVGQPLPLLPLWLAENVAVPLELEATYQGTCRIRRIPCRDHRSRAGHPGDDDVMFIVKSPPIVMTG